MAIGALPAGVGVLGVSQTQVGAVASRSCSSNASGKSLRSQDAVRQAREGEGGALLIEGSAGIGKTALLGWAAEHSASQGFQVLVATGRELERGFPFGIALQLFEPFLATLDSTERDELLSGAASPVAALLGAAPSGPPLPDQAFAIIHGLYWRTA